MSIKRRLQSLDAGAQEPARTVDSPYLTSKGAVEYLQLPSLSSLYSHIRENRLPVCRAGGDLRFDKRELDAWLRGTTAIELARAHRIDRSPRKRSA